jgi:hypothetical protein
MNAETDRWWGVTLRLRGECFWTNFFSVAVSDTCGFEVDLALAGFFRTYREI